jgi:glycine/D-amino acid oxidase-like deaminating enzyme
VIGEHLAELALGLEPTFDLGPFSLTRFAEGRARLEQNVV